MASNQLDNINDIKFNKSERSVQFDLWPDQNVRLVKGSIDCLATLDYDKREYIYIYIYNKYLLIMTFFNLRFWNERFPCMPFQVNCMARLFVMTCLKILRIVSLGVDPPIRLSCLCYKETIVSNLTYEREYVTIILILKAIYPPSYTCIKYIITNSRTIKFSII